jgi:hypothetical protein
MRPARFPVDVRGYSFQLHIPNCKALYRSPRTRRQPQVSKRACDVAESLSLAVVTSEARSELGPQDEHPFPFPCLRLPFVTRSVPKRHWIALDLLPLRPWSLFLSSQSALAGVFPPRPWQLTTATQGGLALDLNRSSSLSTHTATSRSSQLVSEVYTSSVYPRSTRSKSSIRITSSRKS